MSPPRVAIIGAGPCGMSVLRSFREAEKKGYAIPEVVCFEKQSEVGGVWTWQADADPVHENGMFRGLWIHVPKEFVEYKDYTFREHFKMPVPSYLPREAMLDYISTRNLRCNIIPFIRLDTVVRNVQAVENGQRFLIESYDSKSGIAAKEYFDYVIVANGHYSYPNIPQYSGVHQFPGTVLHSSQFRSTDEVQGKRVLLVGNSYSTTDIALMCNKTGECDQVIISYHTNPTGFAWPRGIEELPCLQTIDGSTAIFKDGNRREVDVIIFCTGYKAYFPFLSSDLTWSGDLTDFPEGLYKGIFKADNPNIMFLGLLKVCSLPQYDAQAYLARDFILGDFRMPDEESVRRETQEWSRRGKAVETTLDAINFYGSYLENILQLTDYRMAETDAHCKIARDWVRHREDNIATYRDKSFISLYTKTAAAALPQPWMDITEEDTKELLLSLYSRFCRPSKPCNAGVCCVGSL